MLSITNNNKKIKYEDWNIVSNDGDSIYALPIEQLEGGQIYVSEDKIRDIVNEELDKRLGHCKKIRFDDDDND
jgi:hypothetical protein